MEILDGESPSCYYQKERIAYMYQSVPTGQVLPAKSRQGQDIIRIGKRLVGVVGRGELATLDKCTHTSEAIGVSGDRKSKKESACHWWSPVCTYLRIRMPKMECLYAGKTFYRKICNMRLTKFYREVDKGRLHAFHPQH